MVRIARCLLRAGAVLTLTFAITPAPAQKAYGPGVSDTEIKIGTTTPFSGPASAYSAGAVSATAYFQMINEQGGINGRKINYVALDDAYSPPKTVEQTRKLIESEEVLFIVNPVGTAPNLAVVKYVNQKQVPDLFIGTGATMFNDPEHYPWTLSWTPHYASEGEIYARYILATKPDAKVGILSQNDDLGRDYLLGFRRGLGDKASKMIVSSMTYNVTDPTVDFPNSIVEDLRGGCFLYRYDPEIFCSSDSQGLRYRLASAEIRGEHRFINSWCDQTSRLRSIQGRHLRRLSEGPG